MFPSYGTYSLKNLIRCRIYVFKFKHKCSFQLMILLLFASWSSNAFFPRKQNIKDCETYCIAIIEARKAKIHVGGKYIPPPLQDYLPLDFKDKTGRTEKEKI